MARLHIGHRSRNRADRTFSGPALRGRRGQANPVSSNEVGLHLRATAYTGSYASAGVADNLTPDQRARAMARIRRKDTQPELALRRALWTRGLRGYRVDDRRFPGRPDIAWSGRRIAVFVDGAFWHGHASAYTLGRHGAYWDEKVARNVQRDRAADVALTQMGWKVLRYWDFDVRRDLDRCVAEIQAALRDAPLSSKAMRPGPRRQSPSRRAALEPPSP